MNETEKDAYACMCRQRANEREPWNAQKGWRVRSFWGEAFDTFKTCSIRLGSITGWWFICKNNKSEAKNQLKMDGFFSRSLSLFFAYHNYKHRTTHIHCVRRTHTRTFECLLCIFVCSTHRASPVYIMSIWRTIGRRMYTIQCFASHILCA